jgi:hypothetical protein
MQVWLSARLFQTRPCRMHVHSILPPQRVSGNSVGERASRAALIVAQDFGAIRTMSITGSVSVRRSILLAHTVRIASVAARALLNTKQARGAHTDSSASSKTTTTGSVSHVEAVVLCSG